MKLRYGRYGWSHLMMSWGLGIVFVWIGFDTLAHPNSWLGFVPDPVPFGLGREQALLFNGIFDAVIGILLLLRWWEKIAAGLAVLHLASILVMSGIDAVLIRDVGLLGMALGLLFWPTHYRKNRWWKFWIRSGSSGGSSEE